MTEHRFGTAKAYARPPAEVIRTLRAFAFVHINKCGGTSVELIMGLQKAHQTAMEMRDLVGAEDWASRFTFSIVRNPFDRVVSIYYYRVRTNQHDLGDRHVNLNQWITKVWEEQDPEYVHNPILTGPCCDWLFEEGTLLVDEVLKLETLDKDWDRVAEPLGISVRPAKTNYNSHPQYRDVISDSSRKTLERAFGEDMDRFGYTY